MRLPAMVRSLWLVPLLGLLMAMAGCEKQDTTAQSGGGGGTTGKSYRIAVIPKGESHLFWKSVKNGVDKAAAETGVTTLWKGPPREDDRSQQIALVEQYITEGLDGICLAPLDSSALVDPVHMANRRNIPVVIFDSGLKGEAGKEFVSFVATDNRKGGQLAGEEMARLLGGKGKVVILRYAIGSNSTEERENGFLDVMAKHPGIEVIEKERYAGTTTSEAQKNAENLLDKLRQADGIFCSNEPVTQAMLNVLRDNGLAGQKKLVGFDTSDALLRGLKEGQINALVTQNPTRMGYLAVMTMVSHLKGEKVEPNVDTGCALVTQQNLDTPEIQEMLVK